MMNVIVYSDFGESGSHRQRREEALGRVSFGKRLTNKKRRQAPDNREERRFGVSIQLYRLSRMPFGLHALRGGRAVMGRPGGGTEV